MGIRARDFLQKFDQECGAVVAIYASVKLEIGIAVRTALHQYGAFHLPMFFKKTPMLYIFFTLIALHRLKSAILRLMLCEQISSYFNAAIIGAVNETIFTL